MANSFKDYIQDSVKIDSGFKNRWDIETRLVNLAEEVGELSHDVLVTEGKKKDKLIAQSLGDDLTNLLYEIFLITDYYQVDLDEAWDKFIKIMPIRVEKRNS